MEPKEAKAWLKKHGFRRALDEKPNTYRARQADPSLFLKGSFRTIEFANGIKAVIGCPTKKSGLS
jgi:hypothetical protein